ncbi:MAG: hypothetical protein ACI8UO_004541 [Verrucomicrobiales bacterium]|jgi:hypothetical protein
MKNRVIIALIFGLFGSISSAWAEIPEGFVIAEGTLSPDGKFGVIAPDWDHGEEQNSNAIVEVTTGRVVHTIQAETGYQKMNHGGLYASWSKDGQQLLWTVDGKWFPRALILIDLGKNGKVEQTDLLAACQDEMLKRSKAKFPAEYKATKEAGGVGTAYPDGFTIGFNYQREEALKFPLKIELDLTNDPKLLAGANDEFTQRLLEGGMTAKVSRSGKIRFSGFVILGPAEALKTRDPE